MGNFKSKKIEVFEDKSELLDGYDINDIEANEYTPLLNYYTENKNSQNKIFSTILNYFSKSFNLNKNINYKYNESSHRSLYP